MEKTIKCNLTSCFFNLENKCFSMKMCWNKDEMAKTNEILDAKVLENQNINIKPDNYDCDDYIDYHSCINKKYSECRTKKNRCNFCNRV